MSKAFEYKAKTGNTFAAFNVQALVGAAMDAAFTACGGKGKRPDGAGLLVRTGEHGYIVLFKPEAVGRGNVAAPASEHDALIRQWAEYKVQGGEAPVPESIAKQVARLLKPAAPPVMAPAAPPPPAMSVPTGAPRQMRRRKAG